MKHIKGALSNVDEVCGEGFGYLGVGHNLAIGLALIAIEEADSESAGECLKWIVVGETDSEHG